MGEEGCRGFFLHVFCLSGRRRGCGWIGGRRLGDEFGCDGWVGVDGFAAELEKQSDQRIPIDRETYVWEDET